MSDIAPGISPPARHTIAKKGLTIANAAWQHPVITFHTRKTRESEMRMTHFNQPIPRAARAACLLQVGPWSVKDRPLSGKTVE